jgi:RimJ/RimL family protein N-acetyltransferase
MNQAAWLVAHVRRLSSASLRNKSQLARDSSLFIAMAILETSRVILRPFRAEDLDLLSGLMANQDFMRFSLGVYSREQTLGFLEKVLTWEREGLPSQFAAEIKSEGTLLGYCGFFHQDVDGKSESEIGYRLHPDYWNKVWPRKRPLQSAITLSAI